MTEEEHPPPPTMQETIQDTIALLKQLKQQPDYTTIRQLDWNLGWNKGIYHLEIIEDPLYDTQAITLAIKILRNILETHTEQQEE
ncbi:hypothetical protein KAR91_00770 [Candidatus Pacearchaeota archaeon]|nr:hypothetical protein [Candidatus Pacearchaeota archaeon]